MMDAPNFDQKGQSVKNQTNIYTGKIPTQPDSVPAFPIPQQIPAYPLDFTGREDEIRILVEQFGQGATITGLRGMGGVGKTALALVLADRLKVRFPDGQLFLNMQGTSKSTLKPEEAMAHVIRSYLGVDASLPEQSNGLSGLYRSVLSDKKALILMDNAASREQVEPLLPPPSCALLVTSRNKFALPGLAEKDLDVLPLGDARKLLLEICGRIGENAEELAKLCGCLPIALRNAAYALKEKQNLCLVGYIERLGDAKKRLALVDASFSTSYELLAPKLQRLWSMLSVFPADFDLDGAVAVWKMEQIPAEDVLSELLKWSLVDYLDGTKRYHLHDLARAFADSRLKNETGKRSRFNAKLRHAEYYKTVLNGADESYRRGGEDVLVGLKLFDREWVNIQAGQAWAKSIALRDDQCTLPEMTNDKEVALKLCTDYPEAGNYVLSLRLHPRNLIYWMETALSAARHLNDRNVECDVLGSLGIAYKNLGEAHKSLEYHKQSLFVSRAIGDRKGEGNALSSIGYAYKNLGDYKKAIEFLEQALTIAGRVGNRRGEGTALNRLGMVYKNLGNYQKALELHEKALAIAREVGNRRGEGSAMNRLGIAYKNLGECEKALGLHEKALAIAREIEDRRGEGAALCNMGNAYRILKEHNRAIEFYQQHLIIACEIGDRRGEGAVLGNLGLAHSDLGEPRKAIEFYEQALKISREIEDRQDEGNQLGNLGRAYFQLGEPRKAIEFYEQALAISREIGDRRGEVNQLFNMSLTLQALGQKQKAISFAKSALEIFEQIESPHAETVRKQLAEWGA